jgi:rhodanese-related sulfurtransferase
MALRFSGIAGYSPALDALAHKLWRLNIGSQLLKLSRNNEHPAELDSLRETWHNRLHPLERRMTPGDAPISGARNGRLETQPQIQSTKNPMKKLLILLAIVFGAVVVHAGEYPDISIKELKTAIADKSAVILDANGSDSYKAGHIPGAVDFEAQQASLAKILPADKHALVVAYCGGPQCNAYTAAAKAAKALGYTNIKHLSAGISGWKEAGAPLEK